MLNGDSGPGRGLVNRSRRWSAGERIVKTALAAGIAWLLAAHLLDNPNPILAPITAIYVVQVTVSRSFTGIAQRLLGLIAGLVVAFGVVVIGGTNALTIALGVLISLLIGVRLRLDTVALTQLMTTAVVGIAAGGSHDDWHYLFELLLDTGVGAAVGVTLNLLIPPPTHIDAVFISLRTLADEIGAIYRDTAIALERGITLDDAQASLDRARRTVGLIAAAMAAISRADESLRYTIVPDERRRALERARRMTRALEHAAIQSRIIHRSLTDAIERTPRSQSPGWLAPDAAGAPLARLFSAAADAVETLGVAPGDFDAQANISLRLSLLRTAHDNAVAAAREHSDLLASGEWVIVGEILGAAAQLLGDLELAAM